MTEMTTGYTESQRASYRPKGDVVIPRKKLRQIVEIPLGFQPLGITSQGNRVVIAAYFEPAICLAEITNDDKGLRFKVNWIRGAEYQGKSVRLFPDIFTEGGANRAQTVNFGPNSDTLYVSRNGEGKFFSLILAEGKWALDSSFSLPSHPEKMVHSALLKRDSLVTIESTKDLIEWTVKQYAVSETMSFEMIDGMQIPQFRYGIGQRIKEKDLWSVTDFRSRGKPGVYREEKLVVPNIFGNGICFLEDGSALVTRYGQGHPNPFNGVPGALIYIPAHLLE